MRSSTAEHKEKADFLFLAKTKHSADPEEEVIFRFGRAYDKADAIIKKEIADKAAHEIELEQERKRLLAAAKLA